MGVNESPEFSDVLNDDYITARLTITSTQSEAKVGGTRLAGREVVTIQNIGNKTVFYGPTGLTDITGNPLYKNQFVSLPIGVNLGVFLICSSGDSSTVIVQEMA